MRVASYLLSLLLFAPPAMAFDEINLHGAIHAEHDISAAAFLGDILVIGADEAVGHDKNENYIQLLKREGDNYRVSSNILVYRGDKEHGRELDIEGLAVEENRIYVNGSHALARKQIKPETEYKKNLNRLATIKMEPGRKQLFRLTLDSMNNVTERKQISLAKIISNDPILAPFSAIPSKENGVDIEAIAAKNGQLYLGFRGPVLRGGFVAVMQLDFDNPEKSYRLLYLNLGGLGIRGMVSVPDGFILLAGPVVELPNEYRLYHWNGLDTLPGSRNGTLKLISGIRPPAGGRAEAIAVEGATDLFYNIIIMFDGIKGGAPRRYTINR
ncbi:Protein of unknown function (DUF3616) [Mariprofundus aestuarium]|uniref:DUF3616 domain-containing protein n=1 Tax=Mariprofundus aestuarium TaxID=1921086 RepID=A0A2K8KVY0_MARES|nr:DUF3616 domain-containing protein [Mariprofundus aestuarium]ATX78990.1 Protein of unknown function (DUF3616) [Mariprofundus aestuarium]